MERKPTGSRLQKTRAGTADIRQTFFVGRDNSQGNYLRLGNTSGRLFFGTDRSVRGNSPELTEGARRATGVSSGLPLHDNPIYKFPTFSSSAVLFL